MNQQDYYRVLRVHPSVSQEEIKEAYKRLAHKHHPDMEGGDAAKFKEVHEAYEVLSDPYQRGVYDTTLNFAHRIPREEHRTQATSPINKQPSAEKKANKTILIITVIIGLLILYWVFSSMGI